MKQQTFSDVGYGGGNRITKPRRNPGHNEKIILWVELPTYSISRFPIMFLSTILEDTSKLIHRLHFHMTYESQP